MGPKRTSPRLNNPSVRKNPTPTSVQKKPTSPTKKPKGKQVRWNSDMDRLMIDVLLEEDAHGQKAKNGFSAPALHKVCKIVNETLDMDISIDNVRARYKSFKDNFRDARKVERNSGFNWDPRTERITADPLAWLELAEKEPEAERFRYKKVPYYDDLSIIIGDDAATGEGGATGLEADNDMPPIGDIGYSHDSSSMDVEDHEVLSTDVEKASHQPTQRKRKRRNETNDSSIDLLADAAQRMARAMEKPDISKLQDELLKVPNLSREIFLKAVSHLGCDPKLTNVFMGLRDEFKVDWLKITLGLPLNENNEN